MTTVAPATGEEGGGVPVAAGGESTTTTTMGTSEPPLHQAPSPSTPAQQHPPPSPLSGCYLLVVLPEPHTIQHKDLILNRLAKGFLSWDKDSCHVDLEKELQALVAQSPEGEEARNGERLIQYATENLVTEVLIFPQSNTLLQCIRNLLASFTKHRHIIHAGYTFGGNGSWILQDGTFSLADFLDAFSEHEVQRVLRAYENSVTVDIHCAGVGDWTTSRLSREACTRACRVRVNPDDVLTAGVPAITSFTNYVGQYLVAQTLDQLMEPSDVVGNIRFSHPTLYVFPGGQGDAALFGINGFNMLVDGGFARKACFWDFARHLDRLDAVLVTRINNSNVGGMSSVLRKKKEMHVYPQIGHFFCNLVERKHSNSPDGDKDIDPLILNLIDMGQDMMSNLRHINLRPHPCYRDPEPINLYHKVGHGTLDMYVLSPSKDSREVREFMAKWNASDSRLFAGLHRKDSSSIIFPVQNLVSICALLVWQPANPEDTITRILFPGSTPQHKIFEGFDRLKHLEFLKRPVCTAKSLSPSASLMTLKDKASILKPKYIERETKRLAEMRREKRDLSAPKKDSAPADDAKNLTARPSLPISHIKTETKAKKVVENKKIESETKEKIIEKELKETKKEVKKVEKPEKLESETKKTDAVKIETEKTAPVKEPKIQKIEIKKKEIKEASKTTVVKSNKSESVTKPPLKPLKKRPDSSGEKKDIMKPSPTTPKKTINGAANKTEVTKSVSKSVVKTTTAKISSVGPAKSAKDANNRKVVEQKNIELSSIAGSTATAAAGAKAQVKSKTTERKAITRRTKPLSPAKARLPLSPAKTIKSAPKTEKEAVIRRGIRGGTSDSSAVSTPSKIEGESAVKLIDKNLTEKSEDMSLDSIESKVLADLKEEREVVEEIEAVLQKAERIEEARKEERFDGDDEITAEALDDKEKDVTEEDITAEMDDAPKKIARKESQELTEEDEYLIVEKEEIYTEDSAQSYDAEHKHHLDEAESEKIQKRAAEEGGSNQVAVGEDKESVDEKMDEIPEKSLVEAKEKDARKSVDFSSGHKEVLEEEAKKITTSATEVTPKVEEKDISGKKDSEEITKEPSSLSPDKLDSSPKPEVDQKDLPEKLEGSQERISTLESGATTTAPTLPEDEKVPLDDIKEDVDEKHVIEEVKEKDLPSKEKEIIPETLPPVSKPEVKVLDVRPVAQQSIQRDVVKTPDEVADLPVHEEVDPKLYSIDDLEKDKDTKEPIPSEESKEPATPPVKEQKGVFSFFGKVADKFEKGYDKLTKKNRRDSEKDIDEKSSKSNSPKEPKPVIKDFLESPDMDKVFLKVGQSEEKVEVEDTQQAELFEANKSDDLDNKLLEENTADVEAFIEETTQKFKNVKDSLQDSLESLEDKVEKQALSGGEVEATLSGAAEKLDESLIDSKEPDKVKFIIPSSEDLEEDDDSDGVVRDFKEAVREVAGVLVGTAGIEIEKEDKSKDVEEIVKKVAKVLKEDDFLTEKTLLSHEHKEDAGSQSATFISHEADVLKKTDEFEFQGQSTDKREVVEEPFVKISDKEVMLPSPVTDSTKVIDHKKDKEDALKMCEDLLNDDIIIKKPVSETKTVSKVDVMDSGIEEICVKKVAERERYEEIQLEEDKIEVEPHLSFEQNLSPGKAELVTVTPGSTPTSPKLVTSIELPEIPLECKNILNQEKSLENILQEFLALKKYKVNEQILEYIIVLKHVPKKKVINVIQELIIKQKIPRENVVDNIEILRAYDVSPEKRLELENHIKNEYLNKNKKITCSNIEKISAEKCISQSLVIEIIEEMVFNNGIPRNTVLEISDESYVKLLETDLEEESEAQAEEVQTQVEDDSILDGFVNISSKEVVEAFLHEERKKSLEEAKIVDDFEAVEQEYKVDGFSVTDKLKKHLDIDVDDVSEHVSETIEADEKFVKETAEKSSKEKESVEIEVAKKISISQAPEISDADTKEKYLDEEKEKTSSDLPQSSEDVDVSEVILDNQKMKTADLIDIKDISVELKEEISEVKRASEVDEGTVKKMFVTASSEDGGHETEICASGTITFTKTPTPDDSLRSIDVKSTPERDSLNLDKDSLQSADSTPEKDSMSDKSYPKGGKITPDDSLEKPLDNKLVTEDVSPAETVFSSAVEVNQRALKSKSPSVEKEVKKEGSPEVSSVSDHITVEEVKKEDLSKPHGVEEESLVGKVCSEIIKDQSKSPSVEKEILKEQSPEKMIISETGKSKSPSVEKEVSSAAVISEIDYNSASEKVEKSKSPSVENEIPTKDASPEKIVEKSKSPSTEREILKETDKSKSPSVEKELVARESSPEKIVDKSKSPSAERDVSKEPSPEKSIIADTVTEVETLGKSKSPSVEKEISEKEPMSEKLVDRSKSPSAEKELSKDPLLEDDKFRSTSVEKDTGARETSPEKIVDKSKSPSAEREILKETSAEVDKSKSPSVEKELPAKESSPEKIVDKSKSPSAEREVSKEPSPEKSIIADTLTEDKIDKSKSPSVEKEIAAQEPSPEKVADKSKSPSAEREVTKEPSPATDDKSEKADKSKSPSVEKEVSIKETSPEKIADKSKSPSAKREILKETSVDDHKSKSPSVEKELAVKEQSPEKIVEKSKSPSPEKDLLIETSPVKSGTFDTEIEDKRESADKSKSPSVEKDVQAKEPSPEKSNAAEIETDDKVEKSDKSKSPSVEKEIDTKEFPPEKIDKSKSPSAEREVIKEAAKSKSPSVEKELSAKEPTPEKIVEKSKSPSPEKEVIKESSPIKSGVTDTVVEMADKSKSPSVEKDIQTKEASPEKVVDQSKSSSVEKELSKQLSSENLSTDNIQKEEIVSTGISAREEAQSKSKSPSMEKEITVESSLEKTQLIIETHGDSAISKSKSPSAERESCAKQEILEKTSEEILIETSLKLDQSLASKEKSPEKIVTDDAVKSDKLEDKSKSPSAERELSGKESSPEKIVDQSELSGAEKEVPKEPSPEKLVIPETEIEEKIEKVDKSKSPSMEKEVMKESSPDNIADRSKSPSAEKEIMKETSPTGDRSKSPSVEKELSTKELSSEKTVDRSKSPSAEKEVSKEPLSEIEKSKSPSVEKEIATKEPSPEKIVDKSKSPSAEREVTKEPSPAADDKSEKADKSKSPSVEKEVSIKETSPEKIADKSKSPSAEREILKETSVDDHKSKSPSVEKELLTKEPSPEKIIVQSKSPSAEKEVTKEPTPEKLVIADTVAEEMTKKIDKSKSPSVEKEIPSGEPLSEKIVDKSKSPSAEREVPQDTSKGDKSKSPSVERDSLMKQPSPEKIVDESKSPSAEKEILIETSAEVDKSKSPSVEKELPAKESTPEKIVDKSKSSSAEREVSKEPSPEKSIISDTLTEDKIDTTDKSKSPSVEKEIAGKEPTPEKTIDLSKSPSAEKDLLKDQSLEAHKSKSPSVEKEITERESSPEKIVDKSKSPSAERELSKEPSLEKSLAEDKTQAKDKSKSPSVEKELGLKEPSPEKSLGSATSEFVEKDHAIEGFIARKSLTETELVEKIDKSRSPSAEKEVPSAGKSISVTPVSEKSELLQTTVEVRKSSVSSADLGSEEKGRSRSHSLFDAGEKTPLSRSRAASLYEDKFVEKVGSFESIKDQFGHSESIFEEKDEIRLSEETIDELQKDSIKRESISTESSSTESQKYETRKSVEDHIKNEYVLKNKLITLHDINELSIKYKIDRSIIMQIIDDVIVSLKINRDTLINFDKAESDLPLLDTSDEEEKLNFYINDEYIAKKKKINSKTVDEIASSKLVTRQLVILVIENIIKAQSLDRNLIMDQDLLGQDLGAQLDQFDPVGLSDSRKQSISSKSIIDKIDLSESPSSSPEPIFGLKSDRSEPHIDEEIIISESKRTEIETILLDDYVTRGKKINKSILDEIVIKTHTPKYIIIEIIEEILIKRHLTRDAIADQSIFEVIDDDESTQPKIPEDDKSSTAATSKRSSIASSQYFDEGLAKSLPYTDYESPFHKAFMGGMTEIRTTHITTTLSGKSTPESGLQDESSDYLSGMATSISTTMTSLPEKHEVTSKVDDNVDNLIGSIQRKSITETVPTHVYAETIETVTNVIKHEIPEKIETFSMEAQELDQNKDIVTSKTIISTVESDAPIADLLKTGEKVLTSSIQTIETTSSTVTEGNLISLESLSKDAISEFSSQIDPNIKTLLDANKSLFDLGHEDKVESAFSSEDLIDHSIPEHLGQSSSSIIRDLMAEEKSYSGKSSPDVSMPKDTGSSVTGKSTPDIPMSPLIRDGSMMQSHFSGRSTPDKRSDRGSRTATPEGFRSGDVIRTIITTTRTMSDDGEIITTTQEVTETTNEKGETVVLAQKTDVTVDEKLPEMFTSDVKSIDSQRTDSPGSDLVHKEIDPASDLSVSSQPISTHIGSSEEHHPYSDEEHSSPASSFSPHHSSDSRQTVQETTMTTTTTKKSSEDFTSAAMSSSFYGELPSESTQFTSSFTKSIESFPEQEEFSFKKFTVEREFAGGFTERKSSKKYIDEADLDFEKALTESQTEKDEHHSETSSVLGVAAASFTQELSKSSESKASSDKGVDKKDPLAGWDSPLGLPSPKAPRKFILRSTPIQPTSSADLSPDSLNFDVINDWGEPMRLPSPAVNSGAATTTGTTNEVSNKGSPGTPKKEKKQQEKKIISENLKNKKRSESPAKRYKDSRNKVQPVYVDLTYVSHHGNSFYTALEFFKKVRARYYVFSGTEPSREVYDALLEAKKTWEDKDLEVTMIPTYDTDTLGYWVADNEEALATYHIDLSPSASRCTINLQDHETSCSAYRLEF